MVALFLIGPQMTAQPPYPYWLRIEDVQGSYTMPYIQSGRDLTVRLEFAQLPPQSIGATVTLSRQNEAADSRRRTARPNAPDAEFTDLPTGEYTLTATAVDTAGATTWETAYAQVGVGTALAAIGDSLTEGYHGRGFKRTPLDLTAARFPSQCVSEDGRNFPQYSPTTAQHRPSVNCFESWMTRLNDGLTHAWQRPVFIANEGWGGYTSGLYLAMMRNNSGGWCDRMQRLQPAVWLIHLGVNDERHHVTPETFVATMRAIVEILASDYGAMPNGIYIARPSYDYARGAETVLRDYIAGIDALVVDGKARLGPDFFAAFATDRERWYGTDPVHPGPEGMDRMAQLWLDALGPKPPEASPEGGTPTIVLPAQTHVPAAEGEKP